MPVNPDIPWVVGYKGEKHFLGFLPSSQQWIENLKSYTESGYPLLDRKHREPFDIWPDEIGIKDQNGHGACLEASALIRMADGTERFITDVKVMDLVVSAEGRVCRVLKTMAREETNGIYNLYLRGHRTLRLTGDHPVLTDHGYIPARMLRLGDWVALPKYMPATSSVIVTADHVRKRSFQSRAKNIRYVGIPGKAVAMIVRNKPPDVLNMTAGLGWILGLYLAEGSSDLGKVNWTLGLHEEQTHARTLVDLIRQELGAEPAVRIRSGGKSNRLDVTLYGVWWADLFESLSGKLAKGKVPHADVMSGPREFLEGVLDGYMAGDGHSETHRELASSISKRLAFSMYDIAQSLGKRPTIATRMPNQTRGGTISRQRVYFTEWATGHGPAQYRETDTHVYRKVTGIEEEAFQGWVFNLEVEGDHSYVAEGIGVHNCASYAQTLGIECARWMKGEPYVELSGDFCYAYCKVGTDNGSSPEQICRFLEANGAAPQALVTKWDINKAHHTMEAKQAALRFRFQRGVKLTELDEIASAVARRVPISITVTAHDGMDHFDKDGIAPNGRDANNHAVLAWGGLKVVGGDEAIKIPNSWSVEWGLEGFMWMKITDLINRPYFESNTIELAIDDPENPMDLQT